eukprot:TRINITY_DN1629_c0_g1_i1.p2 TRINITY_DN1629_c0_g1~~TRINITY_DN1629_c0_g1_i1.p2  ORF type:complete len:186 (-),score=34.49 TRINITY_DN1629_c0_g1_i1:12-569(-)
MADIVQERIELPNAADKRKVAFMLHNVFTPEECKELIRHSEAMEYKPALVNIGGGQQRLMPDVRNNERVIEDTEERSEWMYQRIREYVPQSWRGRPVVGLNERLRYLRYDPGQKFEPHMDGTYMRTHGPKRVQLLPRTSENEVLCLFWSICFPFFPFPCHPTQTNPSWRSIEKLFATDTKGIGRS